MFDLAKELQPQFRHSHMEPLHLLAAILKEDSSEKRNSCDDLELLWRMFCRNSAEPERIKPEAKTSEGLVLLRLSGLAIAHELPMVLLTCSKAIRALAMSYPILCENRAIYFVAAYSHCFGAS